MPLKRWMFKYSSVEGLHIGFNQITGLGGDDNERSSWTNGFEREIAFQL